MKKSGKKSAKLKYITRFEYGNTYGYWVRFEGQFPTSKLFSDGVHGGKSKALKAALAFRDDWVNRHDLTRRPPQRGMPGPGRISKKWHWQRKSWSLVWEAYIKVTPGPGHSMTRYSIDRWGTREAKRLCQAWLDRKRIEQHKAYGLAKPSKPKGK